MVDARRCISYQSIENRAFVPLPLRRGFRGRVFGCDICQDVCPFNRGEIPTGDAKFEPRPIALMSPVELAALSAAEFTRLAAGTALGRAQYNGIRRNALFALGAARDSSAPAQAIVRRLVSDPSPVVAEAAAWALAQLGGTPSSGL